MLLPQNIRDAEIRWVELTREAGESDVSNATDLVEATELSHRHGWLHRERTTLLRRLRRLMPKNHNRVVRLSRARESAWLQPHQLHVM